MQLLDVIDKCNNYIQLFNKWFMNKRGNKKDTRYRNEWTNVVILSLVVNM